MKIELTIAREEFSKWLDYKRVYPAKRERNIEQEDVIVGAIAYGDLIIDEDFNMIYTLREPVKSDAGEVVLSELKFKPRIRKADLNAKYKGLKANDPDGRLLATTAALTNQNTNLIGKLDTEDISVCESIAVYFL